MGGGWVREGGGKEKLGPDVCFPPPACIASTPYHGSAENMAPVLAESGFDRLRTNDALPTDRGSRKCRTACLGPLQCQAVKRRLFIILSALSLLLFVAVCVLWVRSYWIADSIGIWFRDDSAETYHLAVSEAGLLRYRIEITKTPATGDADAHARSLHLDRYVVASYPPRTDNPTVVGVGEAVPIWLWRLGFNYATPFPSWNSEVYGATCPHWFPALLLVGMPAGCLVRRARRRHRAHAGVCPACGYDLRATPGRCPECGHSASADEPC